MVDSILDWDSLWDRVEYNVNIDLITTKMEFKQRMIDKFFKGKTNPKGYADNQDKLIDELWDYGVDNNKFPQMIEIVRTARIEIIERISEYHEYKPARYEKWENDETVTLQEMREAKHSFKEIGFILNRSASSVKNKYYRVR